MLSPYGRNKRPSICWDGRTDGLDVDVDAIGVLTRRKKKIFCSCQNQTKTDNLFLSFASFIANEGLFVLAPPLPPSIFGCEINEL